jgi:hypothetical protein
MLEYFQTFYLDYRSTCSSLIIRRPIIYTDTVHFKRNRFVQKTKLLLKKKKGIFELRIYFYLVC